MPATSLTGTITFAVPPEAAQRIASVEPGSIYLSLVPPDFEPVPLPPFDTEEVLPGEDQAPEEEPRDGADRSRGCEQDPDRDAPARDGGVIAPGLTISAEALFARAARLPRVDIRRPPHVIGTNTVVNMQSGIYFGYLGLVDGIGNLHDALAMAGRSLDSVASTCRSRCSWRTRTL